jgi:hypothetical protein
VIKADCEYVLKIQKANQFFENEVSILRKLNQCKPKISPFLFDSWTFENQGFIVMEKNGW